MSAPIFLAIDIGLTGAIARVDADKRARAEGMTRAQWGILLWLERQRAKDKQV